MQASNDDNTTMQSLQLQPARPIVAQCSLSHWTCDMCSPLSLLLALSVQLAGTYCRWMIPGLWPFVWALVLLKVRCSMQTLPVLSGARLSQLPELPKACCLVCSVIAAPHLILLRLDIPDETVQLEHQTSIPACKLIERTGFKEVTAKILASYG